MKKILLVLSLLTLVACGGGGSDSGGMNEATIPGTNIPARFVGTYSGNLNLTASALGLSQSDTFPITVTVTGDGMLRFDGDEPDETFTVGLADDGSFSGGLTVTEDECSGTINVSGTVDGNTARGDVNGEGSCSLDGQTVSVTLEGDFSANR